MAEKALVNVTGISFDSGSGLWMLTLHAIVTDGDSTQEIMAYPTSSTFVPLLPAWRARAKSAVVDAAAALSPSLTVDQVIFGDLSVA